MSTRSCTISILLLSFSIIIACLSLNFTSVYFRYFYFFFLSMNFVLLQFSSSSVIYFHFSSQLAHQIILIWRLSFLYFFSFRFLSLLLSPFYSYHQESASGKTLSLYYFLRPISYKKNILFAYFKICKNFKIQSPKRENMQLGFVVKILLKESTLIFPLWFYL